MTITKSELVKSSGSFQAFVGGTYNLEYVVTGDDQRQNVPSILSEAATAQPDPIPLPNASYIGDETSRARQFGVESWKDRNSVLHWTISVTFAPPADGRAEQTHSNNPLEWQPTKWLEYEKARRGIPEGENQEEFTGLTPPRQSGRAGRSPTRPDRGLRKSHRSRPTTGSWSRPARSRRRRRSTRWAISSS